MAHLRACEVRQLLHNKFVVVMGDSVQRAVYKDLVLLLQKDCLLSSSQLRAQGELSFERDVLLEGGSRGRLQNGTHYREVRQFRSGHHLVRFYFLTRVHSPYVDDVLDELRQGRHAPDVVVMNSCLLDLSRYGRDFRRSYPEDLERLFRRLARVLPLSCLMVWNTAMPVAETMSGGFLPSQRPSRAARLRGDVMEANFYSSREAGRHGFDVLDLHFHFRHASQHRHRDGVHWDERAHRHLSQLLLAHLADAWGVDLPCRRTVGSWIRDGRAGTHPGPTGRRQPRDHRRDRGESSLRGHPPASPGPRAPRRPSVSYPQARQHLPDCRQDAYSPSNRSARYRHFSRDSPRCRIGHTREDSSTVGRESRVGRESWVGPIRTAQHGGRRSPPYPPRRSREPPRHQGRCTTDGPERSQTPGLGRQT
ncbi:PC-esterase domain-containing protein 1B-like [Cynocephalus volans]|uniref:PC-esterase domain-containing protein 1B-like n=1 Tax=Cynocephalus volans TaxID=110931 RepID=UPI002FC6DF3C